MNRLNVTLYGFAAFRPSVYVDGKAVCCKKNAYGNYTLSCETDKNRVNVSVYKFLEINGRFWFLFSFLFYLLGIFGIFDTSYDKKCLSVECSFDALVSGENSAAVRYVSQGAGAASIGVEATCPVVQLANACFVDERAKKRLKIMRTVKLLFFFAAIIAIVAAILAAIF